MLVSDKIGRLRYVESIDIRVSLHPFFREEYPQFAAECNFARSPLKNFIRSSSAGEKDMSKTT